MTFNRARISGHRVIMAVVDDTGLPLKVLLGQCRIREVARPRQVCGYLMRRLCPHLSYPAIGRLLGGRDHTTILHAERTIIRLLPDDPDLARQVERIEAQIIADAYVATETPEVPFAILCASYAVAMRRASA